MCVKQSHLLLICKGWSFIKQNNLWLLLKMAKLFYQVKEENFSAKISNWEHSRYCEKIQTILFSMLHSQHWYRKFDLFYLWEICGVNLPPFSSRQNPFTLSLSCWATNRDQKLIWNLHISMKNLKLNKKIFRHEFDVQSSHLLSSRFKKSYSAIIILHFQSSILISASVAFLLDTIFSFTYNSF